VEAVLGFVVDHALGSVDDLVGDLAAAIGGQPVRFTDTSGGGAAEYWEWSFGDGETSNEQNPTHAHDQDGSYTVTLRAVNSVVSDSAGKTVVVEVGLSAILDDGGALRYFLGDPIHRRLGVEVAAHHSIDSEQSLDIAARARMILLDTLDERACTVERGW